MKIYAENIETLVEIVYGLVQKGLQFNSFWKDGRWEIELTGGY